MWADMYVLVDSAPCSPVTGTAPSHSKGSHSPAAASQVVNRQHVKMVVWERGAGRTLACGTGEFISNSICLLAPMACASTFSVQQRTCSTPRDMCH